MTWINTIKYDHAKGSLLKLYNQVKGPNDNVDNIMLAHSLRPHSMQGHMTLYKYVLHHPHNTIDKWFLECIGVYVSFLNKCDYCVEHHFSGMKRLLANDELADAIYQDLPTGNFIKLNDKQLFALKYAKKLTRKPDKLKQKHITKLQNLGWSDGEILEINQVTSYFNYANRTVLGLGINSQGDDIGLSPHNSNDLNDWNHR